MNETKCGYEMQESCSTVTKEVCLEVQETRCEEEEEEECTHVKTQKCKQEEKSASATFPTQECKVSAILQTKIIIKRLN